MLTFKKKTAAVKLSEMCHLRCICAVEQVSQKTVFFTGILHTSPDQSSGPCVFNDTQGFNVQSEQSREEEPVFLNFLKN